MGDDDDALVHSLREIASAELTAEERVALGQLRARLGDAAAPCVLDRYRLGARLGAGSGGVVYHAHDLRLARDVAVKLVVGEGPAALDAAVTEARALAAVRHPNVLAVHDAGLLELDGTPQAYVITELVHGVSLRQWLSHPQPLARVLAVFVAAARGLAAIHHAGLVHGDFKLDNVLLGVDDGVRVCDFGLASDGLGSPDEPRGTPGYLAPELTDGARPSARSDQFAFAMALHRAVYRRPPVRTDSGFAIGDPAGTITAPRALQRILARGLALDPRARARDMDEVAAALARVDRRSRALVLALGTSALAGLAALWAAPWSTTGEMDPCRGRVLDREPRPAATLELPPLGVRVIDPAFATPITRVATIRLTQDRPQWEPGTLAWSADERWFVSRGATRGHVQLHDGSDGTILRELAVGIPWWSARSPAVLYGLDPASGIITAHDVAQGDSHLVHELGACASGAWRTSEGSAWTDDRIGVACGDTSSVLSLLDAGPGARLTTTHVLDPSPSGALALLGTEVRNDELALLHTLDVAGRENATMTRTREGRDLYVAVAFDPSPRGSGIGSVVAYDLADARLSHVALGPANGWPYPKPGTRLAAAWPRTPAWVAMRSTGDPHGTALLDQELLLVDVERDAACRVAHVRSDANWQLALSPSATRVLFESDWHAQGGSLHTLLADLR